MRLVDGAHAAGAQGVGEGVGAENQALGLSLKDALGLETGQHAPLDQVLRQGGRVAARVLLDELRRDLVELGALDEVASAEIPDEPLASSQFVDRHGATSLWTRTCASMVGFKKGLTLNARGLTPFETVLMRRYSPTFAAASSMRQECGGDYGNTGRTPRQAWDKNRPLSNHPPCRPAPPQPTKTGSGGSRHAPPICYPETRSQLTIPFSFPSQEEPSYGRRCLLVLPLRQRQKIQVVLPADPRDRSTRPFGRRRKVSMKPRCA